MSVICTSLDWHGCVSYAVDVETDGFFKIYSVYVAKMRDPVYESGFHTPDSSPKKQHVVRSEEWKQRAKKTLGINTGEELKSVNSSFVIVTDNNVFKVFSTEKTYKEELKGYILLKNAGANVPNTFESVNVENVWAIKMDILKRVNPPTNHESGEILRAEVVEMMTPAWDNNLSHGDLLDRHTNKGPSNMKFTNIMRERDGRLVVIDFELVSVNPVNSEDERKSVTNAIFSPNSHPVQASGVQRLARILHALRMGFR